MNDFRAPRWLPGGHVQTIWPALFSRRFDGAAPVFRRERWATPDGDFVDVDWQGDDTRGAAAGALPRPRGLVVEPLRAGVRGRGERGAAGASRCRTFAAARARSTSRRAPTTRATTRRSAGCWRAFARCTPDRSSRSASRSAATRCCATPRKRARAPRRACAPIAAVSAPLDLAAGGRAIGRGFGRQVYTRMFLRTMKKKALRQAAPASRPVRRRGDARGARPARLRRGLHRPAARLRRRRRLLRAQLGQSRSSPGSGFRRWC